MSHENSSTDLKKDDLQITSAASEFREDIISEEGAERKIHPKVPFEPSSCSNVLGSSDPSIGKLDSHSVEFNTSTVAKRYKITLAQARRMALNAAKRAKRRRERALEKEAETEHSAGTIE